MNEYGEIYTTTSTDLSYTIDETDHLNYVPPASVPEPIDGIEWKKMIATKTDYHGTIDHPMDLIPTVNGKEVWLKDEDSKVPEILLPGMSISIDKKPINLILASTNGDVSVIYNKDTGLFFKKYNTEIYTNDGRLAYGPGFGCWKKPNELEPNSLKLNVGDIVLVNNKPFGLTIKARNGYDFYLQSYANDELEGVYDEKDIYLLSEVVAKYNTIPLPTIEPRPPEKEVRISLWKNPKPNTRNTKKLNKGDRVLIDSKPLDLKVLSTIDDVYKIIDFRGNIIEEKLENIYPIYETLENVIRIGNLVEYGSRYGIVTKITDNMVNMAGGKNTPKNNIKKIFSRIQPKQEYLEYLCGTIEYKDRRYNTIKELQKEYNGIKFTPKVIDYSLAILDIAEFYKIPANEVKPKEENISKILKTTLDHPLNIEKKRWALLVGPSGSGKTELAIAYANEKKKAHIILQGNAQVTTDDLKGYKSITTGKYFASLLRDAVENGKIFILDEIDACNPNTLLVLNSLKQTHYQFEDKLVEIHEDFRLIATANTLEYSEEYNARSPMDKATKARFKIIKYDMKPQELSIRYGLKYVKQIANIDRLTPREVEGQVIDMKIEEMGDEAC